MDTDNKQNNQDISLPDKVWLYIQKTNRSLMRSERMLTKKFQETDKKFQETDKKFQETDKKLQETSKIVHETTIQVQELKERFLETDRQFKETDKKFLETDKKFQETDKYLKELGSQIGGLHNKFGFFTEGLMIPSINKILKENFNCGFLYSNPSFRDNGNSYEIDVLGVSATACYLVEIKSNIKYTVLEQHSNKLKKFSEVNKRYSDLPKYGIIAATNYKDDDIKLILNAGFYFISLTDNIAHLITNEDFIPKKWE